MFRKNKYTQKNILSFIYFSSRLRWFGFSHRLIRNIKKCYSNFFIFGLDIKISQYHFMATNPFAPEGSKYGPPHLNADISYLVCHCCFMRYSLMKGSVIWWTLENLKLEVLLILFSKAHFWITSRHFSDFPFLFCN